MFKGLALWRPPQVILLNWNSDRLVIGHGLNRSRGSPPIPRSGR
jgi:hypothetical protein